MYGPVEAEPYADLSVVVLERECDLIEGVREAEAGGGCEE